MIEQLLSLDQQLFFLINRGYDIPLVSDLLVLLRNKYFWIPLYVFVGIFLLKNFKKDGVLAIACLILTIFISDQFSSAVLKPLFERTRPCNDINLQAYVNLLINCGSGYSFPSSHATNHFAFAQMVGLLLWRVNRSFLPVGLLWAAVISFAQVYVGVHYPFDVVGGALIGIFIGSLIAWFCKRSITSYF